MLGVAGRDAFGQLDLECGGSELMALQRALDENRQIVALELQPGYVDRNAQVLKPLRRPALRFARGGVERPHADFTRQPHRLDNWNEARGGDRAAFGMVPADQRFGAAHPALSSIDQRLEIEPQLAPSHRLAQILFESVAITG